MKVSLRKANALQNEINDRIRSIQPMSHSRVSLNEFQNVAEEMARAEVAFIKQIDRIQHLELSLFEIRKAVAHANSQQNISDLLADVAFYDRKIKFYTDLSNQEVSLPLELINKRLDKIKNSTTERDAYYGRDTVDVSVVTDKMRNEYKTKVNEMKRKKQASQDRLLELNIKTEITLSSSVVDTLSEEGIL